MKSNKIIEVLVLIAIFAIWLTCMQVGIIVYKLDGLKTESHYHYLLPRDGQCKVRRLKLNDAYEDRMVCHWELK